MKSQPLSMDLIRTDGGTQMRASIDQETYFDYRDKWNEGVEFDPIIVYYDGAEYWLADGFHRFYGAREAHRSSIPCEVRKGTQRDAILFAAGANATHGKPRSNEDKKVAVTALLEDDEWGKWSDRQIAERAAVSNTFVGSVRKALSTVDNAPEHETRQTKDGRQYPARRKGRATHQRESGDESESTGAAPVQPQRPAKATVDMPESYQDDAGNEVPESMFPVWRERDTYFRICDDLKTLAGEIRELSKTAAGKGCSAIAREVDEAGKALALLMPSVVDGKKWKSLGESK